ncbi:AraC family transcriptional regulator [Maricurvus nonylphenolicus]|uniref:AraC family transcriptional regulator n=1 Tax=Maricurvus nonylphenolicus TaxID=1008307 RepID=UPI0036F3F9C7
MTPTSSSSTTVLAGIALALSKALESKGIDSQKILHQAGIDRTLTNDPMDRLSNETINTLCKLSVEATGDPCFGLYAGRFVHSSNIHALGFALLSSQTLFEFCERLSKNVKFASQNGFLEVHERDNEIKLEGYALQLNCFESQDMFDSFMIHAMRLLYKEDFAPLQVNLERPEPPRGAAQFENFFQAPVTFGNDNTSMTFNKEDMISPLIGACPELAKANDDIIASALAKLEKNDIVKRTEAVLIEILSEGHITKEKVSNRLNMSASTLSLKLSQQGTSYREVLDKIRKEYSFIYVSKEEMPISEIAFRLGFADSSVFSRTFKRWTGFSPSHFRSQQ